MILVADMSAIDCLLYPTPQLTTYKRYLMNTTHAVMTIEVNRASPAYVTFGTTVRRVKGSLAASSMMASRFWRCFLVIVMPLDTEPMVKELLLSGIQDRNTKAHEDVPSCKYTPDSKIGGRCSQYRSDEDDACAEQHDDVWAKPVEKDAADNWPNRVNNGISTTDDAELCVRNAELVAQCVLQRPETRLRPGLPDRKRDETEKSNPFERPRDVFVYRIMIWIVLCIGLGVIESEGAYWHSALACLGLCGVLCLCRSHCMTLVFMS